MGCVVSNMAIVPGGIGYHARAAGTFCTIMRKLGERVVVQIPDKSEVSVDQECMAVVGELF